MLCQVLFYVLCTYTNFYLVICVTPTTKGKELAYFDGYEYRQKGVSVDGETQWWSCVITTCNGRAHSPVNTLNLRATGEHNHMRVATKHAVSFYYF
jgi:hypothetical protein